MNKIFCCPNCNEVFDVSPLSMLILLDYFSDSHKLPCSNCHVYFPASEFITDNIGYLSSLIKD